MIMPYSAFFRSFSSSTTLTSDTPVFSHRWYM